MAGAYIPFAQPRPPRTLTHAEARAQGYTIDEHGTGRPCAYKGPRFNPVLPVVPVYTELEERMIGLLEGAEPFLERLGEQSKREDEKGLWLLIDDINKVLEGV